MSPQVNNVASVLDQPLYDTVHLAAAAGPLVYRFFSVPQGGILTGVIPKTVMHTNLVQAGQLEQGVTFNITALTMTVRQHEKAAAVAPTQADYTILQDGLITVDVSDRNWGRFPVSLIPSGGGELYFSSDGAAFAGPAVAQISKGIPATANKYNLQYPIPLGVQENFSVSLHIDGTIAAVMDVMFFLHGAYVRSVA